jgi:small subunit ribosomal protein S16
MSATIRLARHGAKKKPFYRIVVTDTRAPRDNARLDQIGTYDPRQDPALVTFKADKLKHWLQCGARPSQTVAQLIKRSGVLQAADAEPQSETPQESAPETTATAPAAEAEPTPDPEEAQT